MRPHYLYRCFDADGFLIYIGCTADVRKRIYSHRSSPRRTSRWLMTCMDRHKVSGPYPGLDAARAAEASAIAEEDPVFNIQARRATGWDVLQVVGLYLLQRGHIELAMETTCTCWPEDREAGVPATWCKPHNFQTPAASPSLPEAAGPDSPAADAVGALASGGTTPAQENNTKGGDGDARGQQLGLTHDSRSRSGESGP